MLLNGFKCGGHIIRQAALAAYFCVCTVFPLSTVRSTLVL